jgi:hypothetical protein
MLRSNGCSVFESALSNNLNAESCGEEMEHRLGLPVTVDLSAPAIICGHQPWLTETND